MDWKRNYHTHTAYCDGKNSAREMIEAAIEKGFTSIGFSGHSHTAFDESYAMSPEAAQDYRRELLALREEYGDRIEILIGLEYDFYSDETKEGWDYRIGSAHYVEKDGHYIPVDETPEIVRDAVDAYYGGDVYAYIEDYFANEARMVRETGCDIIGHFDLVKKFNRYGVRLFDEQHPRYVAAWKRALVALVPEGVPFEINTASMSWREDGEPYPSREILAEIHRLGGTLTISTDSHETGTLDRGIAEALQMAADIGYTSLVSMSPNGAIEIPIR